MKPAPFDYVRADSVEHAVAGLAAANAGGEGKVIAGGQSLMPLLALRLAQPSVLVDINRITGLDAIGPRPGGGLRIGALTRYRALAAQREHPLLAEAARWVGHAAIRTRGTLGGSLDDDEIIEAVEFPAPGRWGFAEFGRRQLTRVLVARALTQAAGAEAA